MILMLPQIYEKLARDSLEETTWEEKPMFDFPRATSSWLGLQELFLPLPLYHRNK